MFVVIVFACALLALVHGAFLEALGLGLFGGGVLWWLALHPPRGRARWFVRW